MLRSLSGRRGNLARLRFLTASLRAALAGSLERRAAVQHHLAVLVDAVAVRAGDLVALLELGMLVRRPGEVVPPDLDVIVGELAQLVVVHTKQLGLLGGPQLQAWDHVDAVGDEGGHDEGVAAAGDDVGDLDVELFVVVDEPTANPRANVDAVEAHDGVRAEKGVEDESDDTGDTMLGEDIHRVVDPDPVFHCDTRQWNLYNARPMCFPSQDVPFVA